MNTAGGENWHRAYEEAPEVFDALCRAEDPDDLVTDRLVSLAGIEGRRVLEVGCGTGRFTRELAPFASSYVALEPGARMLAMARARCAALARSPDLVRARGEAVPLPDACVDVVVAAFVLVHLREAIRREVCREMLRVLPPSSDGGVWLVENHHDGEFQELRGRAGAVEDAEFRPLIDELGFSVVETVDTEIRFPSSDEASRVLGYLCGEWARMRLEKQPRAVLGHRVAILHRPAG